MGRTDTPHWGTLFWDSYKTSTFNSCELSAQIGGCLGAGILTPTICATFPLFCFQSLETVVDLYYYAGMAITAPITIPLGFMIGQVLSFFYAYAATDRNFRKNTDITPAVESLLCFEDKLDQQFIFERILEIDNQQKYGMRSYESANLINILKSDANAQTRWQALQEYLQDKSGTTYTNNGKKLFNAILDIVNLKAFKDRLTYRNAIYELDYDYLNKHRLVYKALMEQTNSEGMNYLHRCIVTNRPLDLIKHIINDKLLNKDCTVQHKSSLYLAAEYGRNDIVDFLMNEDASCLLHLKETHPIIVAARHGQLTTVQHLLLNDPNLLYGKIGQLTFLLANENGHANVVNFLLQERIDANLENAKQELRQLHRMLFTNNWDDKGWGFFCDGIPDGIDKQQKFMIQNNLGKHQIENISRLAAFQVHELGIKLIHLANSFGKHHNDRKKETRECYDFARNFGNNLLLVTCDRKDTFVCDM